MSIIKRYFENFYKNYSALGIVAATAVMLKIALFYYFIGTIINILPVFIVSCVLTYLLFASFRNKWIPLGIFIFISIIMFCNVMYYSFFSRYLSVNMISALTMFSEITSSIAAVFRATFLLLFADLIVVIVCLIRRKRPNAEAVPTEAGFANNEDSASNTALEAKIQAKLANIEAGKSSFANNENDETNANGCQPGETVIANRKERNKSLHEKTARKWLLHAIKPVALVLIITMLIANVTGSNFIKSISHQEIITHHIKDIVQSAFSVNEQEGLSAFQSTYRQGPDSELFGIAEGKNLIIIAVESLQNFVIGLEYNGQEITPNINRLLLENTIYFDNFFQQLGSGNTSDAEFTINNGLLGTIMSYTNRLFGATNYFRGLPVMLREKGYDTAMFHAFERRSMWSRDISYYNMGFNRFYGGLNNRPGDGVFSMDDWIGWGLSDTSFFRQSLEFMEGLTEPFYGFFLTLTSHWPYEFPEGRSTLELLPEDEDTMMGQYFVTLKYADYAVGRFLDELKERGWYDNSIIVVLGDHLGLPRSPETDESVERIIGRPYDFDVMMSVPLLITIPNAELDIRQTISVAGGQMDMFPTLAYLMGFERLDTLYLGQNLLATSEGFVVQHTHMTRGSFFKNDIAFEMARNGVFEHSRAWNFRTGQSVPLDKLYEYHIRALQIIDMSEYILRSDAIRRIFVDGEDIGTGITLETGRFHPPEIVKAGVPGVLSNTIEAMNFSVDVFYATVIRLELEWDSRVFGNGDLPLGFDIETGEWTMTAFELIDWMEAHAGATIILSMQFHLDGNVDDLMKHISERSPAAAERIIIEVSSLSAHSGRPDTILNISGLSESASEIKTFVANNDVWAIMMNENDATGRFEELMGLDTVIYIIDEEGVITKVN